MSHRSPFVFLLVVLLLALTCGATFAQAGETKQVGLVVTFPDGVTQTEIVTVAATATTLDALKASKFNVVTAESTFGTSLCKINTTGCPSDNCFCEPDKFWAYYHLVGTSWTGALESIGSYVPANRAVEGFAWSGFDANFNPTVQPPVYTFDQLLAGQTTPVGIPEPGTILLLGSGVAALAGYVRRARNRAAQD